jgi:hypothetical protein
MKAALLLLAAGCLSGVDARREHLKMVRERRQYVVVSSFGLLQGGQISLKFLDVSDLNVLGLSCR